MAIGFWQIALKHFLKFFLIQCWKANCQLQEANSNIARYV
jgi:hypothetical protein